MSKTYFYLNLILHWASVWLYLYAAANLFRVRRDIDRPHLAIFLTGSIVMATSLISVYRTVGQRPLLWAIGHLICGYALYYIAKHLKNLHFNFFSQITDRYNKFQKKMIRGFDSPDATMITMESLRKIPIGKTITVNPKVQFEKKSDPRGNTFFETRLMAGGEFGVHKHDGIEVCVIDQGCLVCPSLEGRKYRANEMVTFAPYTIHWPYAEEFTRIRVYFYDNGDTDK